MPHKVSTYVDDFVAYLEETLKILLYKNKNKNIDTKNSNCLAHCVGPRLETVMLKCVNSYC